MRPIQIDKPRLKTKGYNLLEQAFVEVVLGRLSAKCKHLGICKMEIVYAKSVLQDTPSLCSSSNKLFALASLRRGVYFELIFERSAIPDAVFDIHFQDGLFKVEEEYIADLELSNSPIRIPIGEYKIRFSETLLTIRFGID